MFDITGIFDQDALMERIDGDQEFLEETIAMLDEDSPTLLEDIRAAATAGDAEALAKSAHALKGMLTNFCAPSSEAAALTLEIMGRQQQLEDAASAVERVIDEVTRLIDALHQFVQTGDE